MRRRLGYVALGLTAYIVSLLVTLPAAQVYRWAEPLLKDSPIRLAGIEGRIWQGKATRLDLKRQPLGSVRWSLSPTALLLGTLRVDWELALEGGHVRGEAHLSSNGELLLRELKGRVPVNRLAAFYPLPMVAIDGLLAVRMDEIRISDQQLSHARGQLGWVQAALTAPQALELGDLLLKLDERKGEGGIRGLLEDQGGPLQAEAELLLEPNGRYHLNGRLAAREGRNSPLGQALMLVGRVDAGGWVNLKFTGKL